MRFTRALAVAVAAGNGLAQVFEGPNGPIPVQKCMRTSAGQSCAPVQGGASFTAANGYNRVNQWSDVAPAQQAMAGPQGPVRYVTG